MPLILGMSRMIVLPPLSRMAAAMIIVVVVLRRCLTLCMAAGVLKVLILRIQPLTCPTGLMAKADF